jgi:dihydrofolate reductase
LEGLDPSLRRDDGPITQHHSKEAQAMRKLISTLFISLDGVVESPDKYVRPEMYEDFPEEVDTALSEQDAVLMGRKIYDEWSAFWPGSNIEPFATFINNTPKFVVSSTLREVNWQSSTLISHEVTGAIAELKAQAGKTIGVHGISLVQSLLLSGALDELRLIQVPVIAGSGRRLLEHGGPPIQLDLQSSRATRTGLNYLVVTPRR